MNYRKRIILILVSYNFIDFNVPFKIHSTQSRIEFPSVRFYFPVRPTMDQRNGLSTLRSVPPSALLFLPCNMNFIYFLPISPLLWIALLKLIVTAEYLLIWSTICYRSYLAQHLVVLYVFSSTSHSSLWL